MYRFQYHANLGGGHKVGQVNNFLLRNPAYTIVAELILGEYEDYN